ncbi:flagellar basal body P-ring formation chaperone FlgA [Pseudogemmobacter blasticus]|uniref:Flagella basal body P-ring formation protein FlgA n=1 Tax=Fuscovulum blasticum DSM 2131 TaxID=1188250 RepID=A0A2T4JFL8_FUSBL|nr:flagellar basal body P-ring formation chaperone FlgA [Fuscovulum blasticum]PTE16686.1 flagella basal body P-ring formation protein FlgA [Fuscovulum blasticum DSM 2131]
MLLRLAVLLALPGVAGAESVVAARTLPAGTVLTQGDLMLVDAEIPGALTAPEVALGQQTRIALYAGRAVHARDIGAPALVQRNGIVTLVYRAGGLTIRADGRALEAGAEGDSIRALNLASKTTVSGRVAPDGTLIVGGPP